MFIESLLCILHVHCIMILQLSDILDISVQYKYNVDNIHFLTATLKTKKKQVILIIHFI